MANSSKSDSDDLEIAGKVKIFVISMWIDFASQNCHQELSQDWIWAKNQFIFEPQRNPRILRNPELDKTIKITKITKLKNTKKTTKNEQRVEW